jgi:hypothetical protein
VSSVHTGMSPGKLELLTVVGAPTRRRVHLGPVAEAANLEARSSFGR